MEEELMQDKNEELADVLTAISVVSKRLATNLTKLANENKMQKGENHEPNKRITNDNRRTSQMCCCYHRHC